MDEWMILTRCDDWILPIVTTGVAYKIYPRFWILQWYTLGYTWIIQWYILSYTKMCIKTYLRFWICTEAPPLKQSSSTTLFSETKGSTFSWIYASYVTWDWPPWQWLTSENGTFLQGSSSGVMQEAVPDQQKGGYHNKDDDMESLSQRSLIFTFQALPAFPLFSFYIFVFRDMWKWAPTRPLLRQGICPVRMKLLDLFLWHWPGLFTKSETETNVALQILIFGWPTYHII